MVTAAKHFCRTNPDLLSIKEISGFLSAVWSLLSAEERLFQYISCRLSQEIERDVKTSTLDFIKPITRSMTADAKSSKIEDEKTIVMRRYEEKRNK